MSSTIPLLSPVSDIPTNRTMLLPHNNTNHTDGTTSSLNTVTTHHNTTSNSNHTHLSTSSNKPTEHVYQVYKTRWVALALFSSLLLCNALLWVTFSPISDITQHYFDSDGYYGSATGVNMLANIFLILYTPGTFIAVLAMKYLKPRKSLLLAGGLTAFGALLRYLAGLFEDDLSTASIYWLIFVGQSFGAIAQPMFLNFPPAIASIWFPVDERDISTTIASMSSPIGNAIGSVIPVIFVTETERNNDGTNNTSYDVKGMKDLFLVEFLVCLVPLLLAWFYFQDAPPTPPSHSTQLKLEKAHHGGGGVHNAHSVRLSEKSMHTIEGGQDEAQLLSSNTSSIDQSSQSSSNSLPRRPTNSYESFSHTMPVRVSRTMESEGMADVMRQPRHTANQMTATNASNQASHAHNDQEGEGEGEGEEDPMASLKQDVYLLLNNKDYIILFFVFSIGVGFFNSIMTLLNQIVSPYGYSNDDAGTFGAVFIFAGLIGAGIGGYVMEKTKAYRTLLKGGILVVCSVVVFFLCMLFSNNFWPLNASMALMGFCILPLLPIMMENCAECTYPVQEELSMGILFTGCNVVGLGFIFALQVSNVYHSTSLLVLNTFSFFPCLIVVFNRLGSFRITSIYSFECLLPRRDVIGCLHLGLLPRRIQAIESRRCPYAFG